MCRRGMGSVVTKLGVIGLSEGNGHPFSFSAIINGFDEKCMRKSGWDVIYNYLKVRDSSEFGILDAKVTHCWTQSEEITLALSEACKIDNPIKNIEEMLTQIDGVIIARDDQESHFPIAKLFLEKGIAVFIDKPLTLNSDELSYFLPFIEKGLLMSTSSFRYADEVKEAKRHFCGSHPAFFRGTILNDWEKYGIHLIEGFSTLTDFDPVAVEYQRGYFDCFFIYLKNEDVVQINCMGDASPLFLMEIIAKNHYSSFQVKDNFSMFKKMLWHFIYSIGTNIPPIDAEITSNMMKVLIAGAASKKEQRRMFLHEIKI